MILGKCPTCGRGQTRTSEQNRLMWAVLTDISEQVEWYGQRLKKEEWKDVFTAALKRQKVVPSIDGGFIVLGASTSRMTIAEMTELIELAMAFGAEKGVVFSDGA
jgi:NAD-dependent SIR2 family protein deacetylase